MGFYGSLFDIFTNYDFIKFICFVHASYTEEFWSNVFFVGFPSDFERSVVRRSTTLSTGTFFRSYIIILYINISIKNINWRFLFEIFKPFLTWTFQNRLWLITRKLISSTSNQIGRHWSIPCPWSRVYQINNSFCILFYSGLYFFSTSKAWLSSKIHRPFFTYKSCRILTCLKI